MGIDIRVGIDDSVNFQRAQHFEHLFVENALKRELYVCKGVVNKTKSHSSEPAVEGAKL